MILNAEAAVAEILLDNALSSVVYFHYDQHQCFLILLLLSLLAFFLVPFLVSLLVFFFVLFFVINSSIVACSFRVEGGAKDMKNEMRFID